VNASRRPFLERIALHRPELRAWAMYDWGNSAFFTTIVAAVFPVYFGTVVGEAMTGQEATRHFGLITGLALASIAVVSPLLGAVADFSGNRKRWLAVFLGIGVASVAGMFWVDVGDWVLGSALFVGANIGAAGTMVFYDALLPHVAKDDEVDQLSTSAYALGYLGGGLLLLVQLLLIKNPQWIGEPEGSTLPVRISLASVALWWLAFAIPLFRRVGEPPRSANHDELEHSPIVVGFTRLWETARSFHRYKHALLMLIAFVIYGDGIGTIFRLAARYADELQFEKGSIIGALLLTQFVGVPAAIGCGVVARRIGAKKTVLGTLCVYVCACLLGAYMREEWHLFALAGMIALVQGGAQALSRSLYASMVPRDRSAEFFGLFAVCDRVAGVLGPLLFVSMIDVTGSTRVAVGSVAMFFVVGGLFLSFVNVEKGRAAVTTEAGS
jgi:UMF1 family MFS transporter